MVASVNTELDSLFFFNSCIPSPFSLYGEKANPWELSHGWKEVSWARWRQCWDPFRSCTSYGISWGQRFGGKLWGCCSSPWTVSGSSRGRLFPSRKGAGNSNRLGDAGSLPARVRCHSTRAMLLRGSQVRARVQTVGQRRETDFHGNIYSIRRKSWSLVSLPSHLFSPFCSVYGGLPWSDISCHTTKQIWSGSSSEATGKLLCPHTTPENRVVFDYWVLGLY